FASDIVHRDDATPRRPGCENNFVLVKIPVWVEGKEVHEFVGMNARFGITTETKEKRSDQTRVSLSEPSDCCSIPTNQISGEVILVHRGGCSFLQKAQMAEAAGASGLLIINSET
ncbi:hypothetical protein M569_04337, partial [Genlisea aurea]